MLKVAKFGGSSLADAAQFRKVRDIVEADDARRLVVVSAPGKRSGEDNKITDLLYLCHAHLQYAVSCLPVFEMIETRMLDIERELGVSCGMQGELAEIKGKLNKEVGIDYLASRGEYLSAKLMAAYLGYAFVDAADVIRFDYDGKLNLEKTEAGLRAALARHDRLVLPGFYGSLPGGRIKVFSRGGSDISGALLAMAADADVYENWTDVSGIMMADPRIVEQPRRIDTVTYSELRELAYMGANVMHEGAIYPVKNRGIPIHIKNTNQPDSPGTLIVDGKDLSDDEGAGIVTGIAGRKNFTVVTVYKQPDQEFGVIRRALEVFEKYRVNVEHIPSGIDSFSIVVATGEVETCIYDIVGEIKAACSPADIRVIDSMALIAVVGRNMASRPGVSGRIFGALGTEQINIRMIAQGSDEINIIVGVENKDFERTIRTIYHNFGKQEGLL